MKLAPSLAALAALLVPACAPPRCPEAVPVAPSAAAAAPAATAATPAGPRVAFTIHPKPGAPSVAVEVRVAAEPEALATFSMAPPGGVAALHLTSVRDDQGPLDAVPVAGPAGRVVLTLPRRAVGEVRLAYAIDASARAGTVVPGVDPDANRFLASGEPLLLLPDGLDDRAVRATVTVDCAGYVVDDGHESMVDGASSFGVGGVREVTVRGRELRRGVYVAGALGRALFDAAEGHDEAVWLGYTSFDPRPIAADVAAFRTAAREVFRAGEETPLTLMIVPDGRLPGAFAAARRARSVIVRVGAGEAWTGPVRIAVATEVLRAWIGERLWIGRDDAEHEAESYWFTEGVTRHLAREMLFRFGLITPREMADEVHGLLGLRATSPRRAEGNAALAAHAREPGVVPLLVARGAVYATGVAARIRAGSKGKRGLEDVLRGLLQKAREARGPLPAAAWREAVRAERAEVGAGAEEDALYRSAIEEGRADDLPDAALGPCFRRAPRGYEAYDLGFDEEATRAAPEQKLAGLRAGGPAERAGLREGDLLVEAVIGRGRSEVAVAITVSRGGEKKTVKYLPAGARAKGTGFVRKTDVPEEACAR
jgi:hypothetical protein